MRKADYQTLARIIKEARARHTQRPDKASVADEIARQFAASASVDKVGFLKACGITT